MLHIDPLGTSAWNALISGRKHWVFFPSTLPRHQIPGLHESLDDMEAIEWFLNYLPSISEKQRRELGMLEYIQEAGECVFVPSGWWHTVINLDFSIAGI
jgi:histone arginine demethylase JMJD6